MLNRDYCVVPEAYWPYGGTIANYIYNCRATTLQEAINLLESDLHNHRIEQIAIQNMNDIKNTLNEQNRQIKGLRTDIFIQNLFK